MTNILKRIQGWLNRTSRHGVLNVESTDTEARFVIGTTRRGQASPVSKALDAAGARPGDSVAIDPNGQARVLGRRPEKVVDNTGAGAGNPLLVTALAAGSGSVACEPDNFAGGDVDCSSSGD